MCVIREEVVKPQVDSCLLEAEKKDSSREMFNNLLRIIPKHFAELVKLSTDEKKTVEGSVSGFDFLVNSFWSVVAAKIQQYLEHISNCKYQIISPHKLFLYFKLNFSYYNLFMQNLIISPVLQYELNLPHYISSRTALSIEGEIMTKKVFYEFFMNGLFLCSAVKKPMGLKSRLQ